MKKSTIVLATHNPGKLNEFNLAFNSLNIELISASDLNIPDVAETGTTFIENAIIKAKHACQHSGLPALSDDSGLVVPALNGAPGIKSARYAGEKATSMENIALLLENLKNIHSVDRNAYFYCVLVYFRHVNDPTPIISEGVWHGTILESTQGEHGFGYDPIFYVPSEQKSAAQLTMEKKNKLSHRGQALQKLIQQLTQR